MSVKPSRLFAVRDNRWQWLYLASIAIAGVWQAMLNAPSGYSPILCGSAYPGTPCVGYSWLDAYPSWLGAVLWFVPIAINVACLVLLFKLGSLREVGATVVWLVALVALSVVFMSVHHWHADVRDLGVVIDESSLHRWSPLGLLHNGLEYAVLPLAVAGIVVLGPTWLVRRRRSQRRAAAERVQDTRVV